MTERVPVLKAAATDGHRLARFTIAQPDGADGMPDVIVPRKAVAELRKLLEEALDGAVMVDLSASKVRFTLSGEGGVVLTSKLIDGTFPDYSRVIPTGNDKLLKVDPKLFFQGVDRVATIATEKTRAVKMGLDTDRVTLSVTSPDNGNAAEELAASYSSEGFEIGFNANYLKDILGQFDTDEVELHLADAGAPTLIREDDSSPALYVLMQTGQGFSPDDDLDCALYVASLMGESEGVMTPDVASAYLGSMTYFIGRYEAQRGKPINVALSERYPEFLKQDVRQLEQICGLRTRGFASRMETISRVLSDAQREAQAEGNAQNDAQAQEK